MFKLCCVVLLSLTVTVCSAAGAIIEGRSIYSPTFDCYLNVVMNDDRYTYVNYENNQCPDNITVSGRCNIGYLFVCSKTTQYFSLVQRNDTIYDIVNPWFKRDPIIGMYLARNNHNAYYLKYESFGNPQNILYPNSDAKRLLCRYKKRIVTFYQCYYRELDSSVYIWFYNTTQDCDERCNFRIEY